MAIIVEDGSIVANANSYVTRAEVDSFMLDRNITSWETALDEVAEAAMIVGQMAMDARYARLYFGWPVSRDQTMAWPRTRTQPIPDVTPTVQEEVIDKNGYQWSINEIPTPVKRAALEAIRVEFEGTFTPTVLTRDDYIKRKEVDVLKTEYFDSTPALNIATIVDQILSSTVADSASSASITMQIDVTLKELIENAYNYNWFGCGVNSVHSWAGTSLVSNSIDSYRDLCLYFFNQKSW